jgi:hypothetical protein
VSFKVTGQFADNYGENFAFRDQIDELIAHIGQAKDPSTLGEWIEPLGCRRLSYADMNAKSPIRLFLYFNVTKRCVVLEGILGPGNWELLR